VVAGTRDTSAGITAGPALLVSCMDEVDRDVDGVGTEAVPVLVSLGDENVPVCEDGSCAL
jgi:hypothetical protein